MSSRKHQKILAMNKLGDRRPLHLYDGVERRVHGDLLQVRHPFHHEGHPGGRLVVEMEGEASSHLRVLSCPGEDDTNLRVVSWPSPDITLGSGMAATSDLGLEVRMLLLEEGSQPS